MDQIQQTITYGVRSGNENARVSQMPKFGIDGLLTPEQINDAAEYVLSLSKLPHDAAAAETRQVLFSTATAAVWRATARRAKAIRTLARPT